MALDRGSVSTAHTAAPVRILIDQTHIVLKQGTNAVSGKSLSEVLQKNVSIKGAELYTIVH